MERKIFSFSFYVIRVWNIYWVVKQLHFVIIYSACEFKVLIKNSLGSQTLSEILRLLVL